MKNIHEITEARLLAVSIDIDGEHSVQIDCIERKAPVDSPEQTAFMMLDIFDANDNLIADPIECPYADTDDVNEFVEAFLLSNYLETDGVYWQESPTI